MSFNDFVHKHNLNNKATSNLKKYDPLRKIWLHSKVGIYLQDGPFSGEIGTVILHPSKRTHPVCYINENYFDSYGCVSLKKHLNFI